MWFIAYFEANIVQGKLYKKTILNIIVKKIICWKIIVVALITLIAANFSVGLEKLGSYVNDEAMVISQEYKEKINSELRALKEETSVEMAVATVKSLEGKPIEDYSIELAHNVLGEKKKDNGLLILLAVDDKKYRIEVGYGLEPVINDAMAGRIGRNVMEPYFKEGSYEEGLLQGTIMIRKILTNQTEINEVNENKPGKISLIPMIIILILVALFIIMAYAEIKKKKEINRDIESVEKAIWIFGPGMFGRHGGSGGGFGGGFGGGGFGGGGFSG